MAYYAEPAPDACVYAVCDGVFFGDVFIVIHWDHFHAVMEHDGPVNSCDECHELYMRQFHQG